MGSEHHPKQYLGTISKIVMGQSPPGSTYNEKGKGLPFFQGAKDFNYRHPSVRVYCSAPSRIAKPGDILLSVRAPIGRVNIADRECCIGRGLSIIRAKSNLDQRYIEFVLRLLEPSWQSVEGGGSVFGNATKKDLEQLSIHWPSPLERQAIAHILGSLDDKIELNHKMNKTLEEMARAIFKSWFIDFDPVKRNIARKSGQNQPSPRTPLPEGEGSYRGGYRFSGLVERARELRKKETPTEAILWEMLRNRRFMGLKFRRQQQIGDYIADFYCHEYKLVVELDGDVHKYNQKKDHKRDAWMEAQGFKVLRFSNEQILDDSQSVLQKIAFCHLHGDKKIPSPFGRGGGEGSVKEFDRLFPDSFEESELGMIPKGWEVGTLECFAILKTRTVQPNTKPEKIWEHYSIPAFDEGEQPSLEAGESIKSGKYIVPHNSVLASKLNPQFPRVWLPDVQDANSSICSTEFMPLVPVVESWRPYLYEMLKSQTIQSEIISRVTGSTGSRQRIKPKEIAVLPCLVPPKTLIDFFCSQVGPWYENLLLNIRQSAILSSLRDTLLPKLISGELRIPDAEKFIEEAGV